MSARSSCSGKIKTDTDSIVRGRVYVYARDQGGAGNWGLVTTLLIPNTTPPDGTNKFGSTISIRGSDDKTRGEIIAVGNAVQYAHIFLFGRDAGGINSWGQIVDLEPGYIGSGTASISSLHLHSNELLVGAGEATGVEAGTGAVYVYHEQTGGNHNWGLSQKFFSHSNDYESNYGFSLDWSADVAVAGWMAATRWPRSAAAIRHHRHHRHR